MPSEGGGKGLFARAGSVEGRAIVSSMIDWLSVGRDWPTID